MEVFVLWAFFALLVAIAASNRGRSAFLWFLLACIISPLLAIVLLLAMANLRRDRREEEMLRMSGSRAPPPLPPEERASRAPFKPDGVYAGIPYRVLRSGEIDAVMHGRILRFDSYDRFIEITGPDRP